MSDVIDIPDVTDLEMVFPRRDRELLPPMSALTNKERRMRGPFCRAVSAMFYSGGTLADHGISVKPGADEIKVMRYLRATLGDWDLKHEHKIGGVAHMLAKWCTISRQKK